MKDTAPKDTALLIISGYEPFGKEATSVIKDAIQKNQPNNPDIFYAGDSKCLLTLEKIKSELEKVKKSKYKKIIVIFNTHGSKEKNKDYLVPHEGLSYSEIMKLIADTEFEQRDVFSMACYGERILDHVPPPGINSVVTFSCCETEASALQFRAMFEKPLERLDFFSLVEYFLSTPCKNKVPYTIWCNGNYYDTRHFFETCLAQEYHKKALDFFTKEIPELQEINQCRPQQSPQESPQESPQVTCCVKGLLKFSTPYFVGKLKIPARLYNMLREEIGRFRP
jgi:hypothetical protein